jgi:hypothetical protein
MELTELFARMRAKENFTCGERGATEEEVERFEGTLGVSLPDAYRAFLREFSFAWWFGHAVFGITDDEEFDALTYTREARDEELPEEFEPVPRTGVVVETYGGGGYYFLHAKPSPAAGRVDLRPDDAERRPTSEWGSFEEFLEYLLAD